MGGDDGGGAATDPRSGRQIRGGADGLHPLGVTDAFHLACSCPSRVPGASALESGDPSPLFGMRALPALTPSPLIGAVLLGVGLLVTVPAAAQAPAEPVGPSLRSTYVVPSGPGEAVRVTVYARRPAQQGRLARRYKGLRANRTVRTPSAPAYAVPVTPVYRSPRAHYVRRYGSYFQVLLRR